MGYPFWSCWPVMFPQTLVGPPTSLAELLLLVALQNLTVRPYCCRITHLSHRTWRHHSGACLEASSPLPAFIVLEGTLRVTRGEQCYPAMNPVSHVKNWPGLELVILLSSANPTSMNWFVERAPGQPGPCLINKKPNQTKNLARREDMPIGIIVAADITRVTVTFWLDLSLTAQGETHTVSQELLLLCC